MMEAYRRASIVRNRRVIVYPEGIDDLTPRRTWPAPIAKGIVQDIQDDLALNLHGRAEPVTRGRLMLHPGERLDRAID